MNLLKENAKNRSIFNNRSKLDYFRIPVPSICALCSMSNYTADENIIGAPKYEKNCFALSKCIFFQRY